MKNAIKALFFPSFLRRFDEKLLLERPWLWSTRLHKVAWPALLLALLAPLFGLLTPIDRPSEIMGFVRGGLIAIVAAQVGLIIYWLHGQDAYNVEREHGIHRDKTGWREFGTYIMAFTLIGISAFLFAGTAQQRVQTIPRERFAYDLLLIETIYDLPIMRYGNPNLEKDLNHAVDQYVLSDFTWGDNAHNWRAGSYRFIKQYANADDFIPLQQQWHNGDYDGLIEVVSRYSGYSADQLQEGWKDTISASERLAFDNADALFKFGFNPDSNWLLTFGAVLVAFIVHLSLLRFVYKHSGWKGLIALPILFVSFYVLSFLASLFGMFFGFISVTFLPLLIGVVGVSTAFFVGIHNIPNKTHFTWKTAMSLYLFPICLIAVPYLLVGIFEHVSDGWFSIHFIDSPPHNPKTWSVAPLGKYVLYSAQFVYVPLLGWLKQKHTQLMSLPRS